jgi:hypothetical protein
MDVLLQSDIPKLLHLTPYQACRESESERLIQSVVGTGMRW